MEKMLCFQKKRFGAAGDAECHGGREVQWQVFGKERKRKFQKYFKTSLVREMPFTKEKCLQDNPCMKKCFCRKSTKHHRLNAYIPKTMFVGEGGLASTKVLTG